MSMRKGLLLILLTFFSAVNFWGCSLPREGLSPETVCPSANVQADVTPFKHAYKITGVCSIGGETAAIDISAVWNKKGNETTSGAILKVNYQGQNYEGLISAHCPLDPLLYGGTCTNRAMNGSLLGTMLWVYYAQVFQTHMMPDLLSEAKKAELRAKDQWPKVPPVVVVPSPGVPPDMHYQNPDYVPIAYKLPFTAGKPSDWKLTFGYQKRDLGSGNWGSINYKTLEEFYQHSGGDYSSSTLLSLAPGNYKLSWVSYQYSDSYGNSWNSGSFEVPVEFRVGHLRAVPEALTGVVKKMPQGLDPVSPKPLAGAADAAKAPAAKLLPTGAPAVRLNAASFTAPALVQPEVQADGRFKINYMLEKNENGVFRKIADSGEPRFQVVDPGDYRIRVRFEGGAADAFVPFTVKAKTLPGPAATQPQGTKIPLKSK